MKADLGPRPVMADEAASGKPTLSLADTLRPHDALRYATEESQTLQTVLVGLAMVYGMFAVLNWIKLPPDPGRQVVTLNVLLLIFYGGCALLNRLHGPLSPVWAEPSIALAFIVAQANTLNTTRLFEEPLYLVFISLAIVAFPCFSASDRWFTIGLTTLCGSWVVVRWLLGTDPATIRGQAFFLVASTALAVVVYTARRANLVRLGRAMARSDSDRTLVSEVLDGAHDLIFSLDPAGRILLVNRAWSQRLGYTVDQVSGTSAETYLHGDSVADFRAVLERARQSLPPETSDLVWVARGGEPVYLRGRLEPTHEVRPGVSAVAGYFRDRTFEHRLERDLARQEDLLQRFAAASHQVFWIFDSRANRFLYVNHAFEDLTGYALDEILKDSNTFLRLFVPDDLPTIRGFIDQVRRGEPITAEHRLVRHDGVLRWVRLNAYPLFDDQGQVVRIAGVSEDITDKKQLELDLAHSEANLRARERLLRQFVANTPAAVAMFDREIRYLAASERWRTDLGIATSTPELVGQSHYDVLPEVSQELRQAHAAALGGGGSRSNEDPLVQPDGSVEWLRWEVQPWVTGGGEVGGLLMFAEVITEAKRTRDALRRDASTDPLTGLANRASFERDLGRCWNRRQEDGIDFALFYVDLDGFKAINDAFGHAVGDRVLVEVADRLRTVCRPGDLIGRLGGDEFQVLARTIDRPGVAAELSSRIVGAMTTPIDHDSGPLEVGVSVGFALSSEAGSPAELIHLADRSMYRHKARRRADAG